MSFKEFWLANPSSPLHRRILSLNDLNAFLESSEYQNLFDFMMKLNLAIEGKPRYPSTFESESPLIRWLDGLLKAAIELVAKHPPKSKNTCNRFGNEAFRDWLAALQLELIPEYFKGKVLDGLGDNYDYDDEMKAEIAGYLINSFGSSQRIDYGTGHELHFLVFLYTLTKTRIINADETSQLVLIVFSRYMEVTRLLQRTYWLEPAGSHGVWGLDDYHFLPFLFGSRQLISHPQLKPKSMINPELVEYYAPDYFYPDAINNILEIKRTADRISSKNQVKDEGEGIGLGECRSGELRWLSPVLDDICAVKSWSKVNEGLVKMWRVEVCGKLPIMQHFLFGKLLPFPVVNATDALIEEESVIGVGAGAGAAGHYTHSSRGDCCGNPLPSIYASAAAAAGLNDPSADEPVIRQPGLPFD